jgi:hypothetical protein
VARHLKLIFLTVVTALVATSSFARDDDRYGDRDDRRGPPRDERQERWSPPPDRNAPPPTETRWVLLGEQTVGFNVDRDEIRVGRQEGSFSRIRIESQNNDIFLYSVSVVFGSGAVQKINVNALIPAGGRSNNFDLTGDRRAIRTIGLTYKARPGFPGRTAVAVYGSQIVAKDPYAGSPYPAGPGSGPPGQPQVLDQQLFDRRSDRVEFRIPRRDLRLSQISLRALDDSVAIESLEIRYNVGPSQTVNIYDRLGPGETTQPIDIDAERRTVTGVTVIKRPSWRPGQNRLELLGLERQRPRPSLGAEPGRAPPGWVLFGAQRVGYQVDRDVIRIGADIGRFTRIALSVRDADVYLREITLVYANGQRETKEVYTSIPANSRTRPIEIEGSRFLREIELVYQSQPNRRDDRATVEVYGEYDRGWLSDRGGYRDYNRGALLLGAHRALMFSNDNDAFVIGQQFGTFRALRMTVRRHAVRITGIRITYTNGQVEELPIFQELLDGQSTQDLNLGRINRPIERVDVRYRTKLNFQGEGIVELWGLR